MAVLSGKRSWFWVLYLIIGLIVAWEKHYITLYVAKIVLSAILAVLLWWLTLLGVSLHVH